MPNQSRPAAIILAAGKSSRMKSPKQLLQWQNKQFIQHVIDIAIQTQLTPIKVVLGAHKEKIQPHIQQNPIDIIINPVWQTGLASSVKAGINSLPSQTSSVFIFLADQPQVKPELIQALVEKNKTSTAHAILPRHQNKTGNPILINAKLFPQVQTLKGDQGFRQLFPKINIDYLDWPDSSILLDIDTPNDLQKLKTTYE